MTDIIEVYNKATGRHQMIPEDWLDSPILNHDVEGNLLERVVPALVVAAAERPTASSTHAQIDAFAARVLGESFAFPQGTKSREDKMAVLDELVPVPETSDTPSAPEHNPDVQLTGPVSDESVIPALNDTQADDEEN